MTPLATAPWRCILCTATGGLLGRAKRDDTQICQWCADDLAARGLLRCRTCSVPQPLDAFDARRKQCRSCRKAQNAHYYATVRKERDRQRKAEYNAKQRARYAADIERRRQWCRASYARHQEKRRDYARRYYATNRERVAARARRYYREHPGLAKSWTRNRKLRAIRAMRGRA